MRASVKGIRVIAEQLCNMLNGYVNKTPADGQYVFDEDYGIVYRYAGSGAVSVTIPNHGHNDRDFYNTVYYCRDLLCMIFNN